MSPTPMPPSPPPQLLPQLQQLRTSQGGSDFGSHLSDYGSAGACSTPGLTILPTCFSDTISGCNSMDAGFKRNWAFLDSNSRPRLCTAF